MVYSALIEERKKYCKRIQTNHLIVLCEIKDDYKSFCNDLDKLIKFKSDRDLVRKLYHVMQGNISIGSSKYKEFIEKHKHTIDIMNKYSCLSNFIVLSYDSEGKRKKDLGEDYFYQYIQEHKNDIETIKAVALKIRNLGFNEIDFGEELDFSEIEYELYTSLDTLYGSKFAFLENMEVSPTYLYNPIKYKTNGSCYCMILQTIGYGNNKEICKSNTIELNSLIFDPDRLPDELTVESTIGVINELSQMKKVEKDDLRFSVDLSVSINDLIDYFERLRSVAERIDKRKTNQKLENLLDQIQNNLAQLQLFGGDFEKEIIDSHANITNEIMEKEKKLYLDRRYWDSIDID